MKHAFELSQNLSTEGDAPSTQTRRHPYQTQTEFHVLLQQLAQVEEISRSHDALLDLVDTVHDADQEWVLASYAMPSSGHTLDVPDTAHTRRSEIELCLMLIALAQAVGLLHEQGLVHGDIRPDTVWVRREHDVEHFALYAPCLLAVDATLWDSPGWHDHLVRRSPEWLLGQRRNDERTDLYALGVLVFEQLHALPSVDVMMHDLAYYSLQSDVFEQLPHLGSILANLLEPDHSLRYQNTHALMIDLEACLTELTGKSEPRDFQERQTSGTLRVPEILIGHQQAFQDAIRAIDTKAHALIIVQGAEGTGKTAFLRRLSSSTSTQRITLLVQCKMTHRSLPSQLLEELAKQLLYWPHHQVKQVQHILADADRHILMHHCTLLRSLFGPHPVPMIAELPGGSVQSDQLDIAIHALLHAVLQMQNRPLVLCIDDLDHRQTPHFLFLRRLLDDGSEPMRKLTIVMSMPHASEIAHHQGLALDALVLSLHPLDFSQTSAFIKATLSTHDAEFVKELTRYIHPITQGVPLLTLHMVFMLHTTDVMTYARSEEGPYRWTLDRTALAQIKLSDAMAEIVSKRLDALEDEVYELLELVALCKPTALLLVLDEALDASSSITKSRLNDACKKGLLMETSQGQFQLMHELIERAITSRHDKAHARRAHERLLQATQQVLSRPLSHQNTHEQHLLRSQRAHHAMQLDLLGHDLEDNLTHMVLDGWQSAITHSDSGARFLVAHHLAEHHFEELWTTSPPQALELTTTHTRDLFTHGEAGHAMALIERAIDLATQLAPTTRMALVVSKLELLTLNAFYEQAMALALSELEEVGIDTLDASHFDTLERECDALLAGRAPLSLLDTPHNQDNTQIQTAAMLAAMLPLTYISEPTRFEAVVYTLVKFNLTSPHTPSASRGYSCYGQLQALRGRVNEAIDFGRLAMGLADRFGDLRAHAIACSDMANYIAHWTQPLESMHKLNVQSHIEATQAGDLQYAGYALMHDCYNRFFAQESLKTLHEDTTRALARCYQLGNQLAIRVIEGLIILLEDFLLDAPTQTREDEFIAACVGESNKMAMALFSIGRSMVCYAHRDHVGAQRHFNRALQSSRFIEGCFPLNELSAISQLTLSAQHMAMTRDLHHKIPTPSSPQSKLVALKQLAHDCPENFQHKWLWLQSMSMGEIDPWRRLELIEKAFEAAISQHRFFDAAVIRMHAATFWNKAGRAWLAQTCQAEATSLWLKWGATGLFSVPEQALDTPPPVRSPLIQYHTQSVISETITSLKHIDDPTRFIKDAMRSLNQVAGSVRAATLLIDITHEHISQGAFYDQVTQTHALLSHRDLDALSHELPLHLIRTVLHGEDTLIIPDVRTHRLTRDDTKLRAQGILTLYILRIPLHMDMKLILYLDHNQLAGVFTPEREQLIKAQIPMLGFALESLERAKLATHHTSNPLRNAHQYHKDVIAMLENFMAEIHESTMLIEHGVSSISPAIQADLLHISRTSNLGRSLLHLLDALETHLLERITRTCCVTELVSMLNATYNYSFEIPSERCDIQTDPNLFVTVLHTMLLIMVPGRATPAFTFAPNDDLFTITLAPVDERLRDQVLTALSTPHGPEEVIAEIFARSLRVLSLTPCDTHPKDAICLQWDQVK